MKKLAYFLPAMTALLFYLFISLAGAFSAIHPAAWGCVALLFVAGILLAKGRWQGALVGLAMGALLILMGMQETGQIIKEWPLGILVCIYYLICGIRAYKSTKA